MLENNYQCPVKMVMADVDGTLVNSDKLLTQQAQSVVEQLHQAGFKFTIISSRPPYGLRALATLLNIDQPMVAFNGGMIFTATGLILQQHFISSDYINFILEQLHQFGLAARLYTPQAWLVQSKNQPYVDRETKTIATKPTVVQDFSSYLSQVLKITGVSDDPAAIAHCQTAITEQLGEKVNVLCSEPYYLDITHQLAHKGMAVKAVAQYEHISEQEIAVIGDMPSDVPMFQTAGLSIAMGNAMQTVKNKATYTTDSNDHEGFAKAMSNFILNQVPNPVSVR